MRTEQERAREREKGGDGARKANICFNFGAQVEKVYHLFSVQIKLCTNACANERSIVRVSCALNIMFATFELFNIESQQLSYKLQLTVAIFQFCSLTKQFHFLFHFFFIFVETIRIWPEAIIFHSCFSVSTKND